MSDSTPKRCGGLRPGMPIYESVIEDKPAGAVKEWTARYLDEELDLKFERGPVALPVAEYIERLESLAVKINAALAAEREKSRILGNMIDGVGRQPGLRQQCKELLADLDHMRELNKQLRAKVASAADIVGGALNKVKELK